MYIPIHKVIQRRPSLVDQDTGAQNSNIPYVSRWSPQGSSSPRRLQPKLPSRHFFFPFPLNRWHILLYKSTPCISSPCSRIYKVGRNKSPLPLALYGIPDSEFRRWGTGGAPSHRQDPILRPFPAPARGGCRWPVLALWPLSEATPIPGNPLAASTKLSTRSVYG